MNWLLVLDLTRPRSRSVRFGRARFASHVSKMPILQNNSVLGMRFNQVMHHGVKIQIKMKTVAERLCSMEHSHGKAWNTASGEIRISFVELNWLSFISEAGKLCTNQYSRHVRKGEQKPQTDPIERGELCLVTSSQSFQDGSALANTVAFLSMASAVVGFQSLHLALRDSLDISQDPRSRWQKSVF